MHRVQDRARREALYSEFIREAAKLFADAITHELDDPAKLVELYAIARRMRLFRAPQILHEAERVISQIGSTYFAPNKGRQGRPSMARGAEVDLLLGFSTACRTGTR